MLKILMVGNYLSSKKGTFAIAEQIANNLSDDTFRFILTSHKTNKIIRILDIISTCLFSSFHKILIDTFSGSAFIIAEVASFIAFIRGKKPILTLHGGKLPEFYLINKSRVIRVFARASYIQTPSLYLQDFFEKQGFRINYLPNPINLNHFHYKRDKVKLHSLLWVRAFTEIYNPELAVKTLHEVKKSYPDTTLTMVGPDKGLLSQTRKLIAELGLDSSVEITGPVKNIELYNYYQTHEVFLNTTSYESFGVAVAEAAACGIPIVSTAVGELPYLYKHNQNILLVNDFDEKNFSTEVIRIFNSAELAGNLSLNARKKVEEFDWEKVKKKWISLLVS
jgi:glycosyltransferase involved in cell wall biosynthesis